MNIKSNILLVAALFWLLPLSAQTPPDSDQNPNWLAAYERYKDNDELLQNQGETVQNTYNAIQYWYDRQAAKQQWKIDRYEFRKQLRLERARRPRIINNGWNNGFNNGWGWNRFNQPFIRPGGSLFWNDGWNWNYGLNFGWPW